MLDVAQDLEDWVTDDDCDPFIINFAIDDEVCVRACGFTAGRAGARAGGCAGEFTCARVHVGVCSWLVGACMHARMRVCARMFVLCISLINVRMEARIRRSTSKIKRIRFKSHMHAHARTHVPVVPVDRLACTCTHAT